MVRLWKGEEKEGVEDLYGVVEENIEREERLFVDGATLGEIKTAIEEHDIHTVYFGHEKNWNDIRKLVNKVRIIVEVDDPDKVPRDLIGRVEVIYRAPSWVNKFKQVEGNKIRVFHNPTVNHWDGKKVYEDDEVLR